MESRSEHILKLASEIIDDIEYSKIDAQAILFKCTRLARYNDNAEVRSWLKFEMQGYSSNDDLALKYMSKTGRWTNKKEGLGYWFPLSQVEAKVTIETEKLKLLQMPSSSSDAALLVTRKVSNELNETSVRVAKLSAVKSRVLSLVHEFATNIYYEKIFDNQAESIFESYKSDIDDLIAENSGDVLQQIPAVIARLAEGDNEAVSQALTTCRRIIESFSDNIFPGRNATISIGDNELSLDASKTLNRINAFVFLRVQSKTRRSKIKQNVKNLYGRVSAGVHSDVTAEEAKSLFLNTYLFLGEILHIGKLPIIDENEAKINDMNE